MKAAFTLCSALLAGVSTAIQIEQTNSTVSNILFEKKADDLIQSVFKPLKTGIVDLLVHAAEIGASAQNVTANSTDTAGNSTSGNSTASNCTAGNSTAGNSTYYQLSDWTADAKNFTDLFFDKIGQGNRTLELFDEHLRLVNNTPELNNTSYDTLTNIYVMLEDARILNVTGNTDDYHFSRRDLVEAGSVVKSIDDFLS